MRIVRKNNNKKNSIKKKIIKFCGILFLLTWLLIITMQYVDNKLLPYVLVIVDNYIKNDLNIEVSKSVLNTVSENNISMDEIYNLRTDIDGNVKSLEVNTIKMNELCAEIAQDLSEDLMEIEDKLIELPLGIISDVEVLSNLGPTYKIWVMAVGNVEVSYKTDFTTAGYNQSHFKLGLEIKIEVQLANPLRKESIEVIREVGLVNTIINGDVPSFYSGSY